MRIKRWWWIGFVFAAGLLAFLPLQLLDDDAAWLTFAGIVPIVTLILIGLAISVRTFAAAAIVAAYALLAWPLLTNAAYPTRETVRWAALGSRYKAYVLANAPQPRQLRHVLWDAWGFAGMETDVYLVFDPEDSLHLRCPVAGVRRLEPHWYSVRAYTSQQWESCAASSPSSTQT